jgi:hypothetical protein
MTRKQLIPAFLLATLAGAAGADDVWLKRSADVRNDQSAAGDLVVPVAKGQRVQLLQRGSGWVQVNANGKIGWVAADSISSREVKPDTNLLGRDSSAEMSSGAAIKGLQPIAGDYARNRHLSKDGLDKMTAIKESVTSKMLRDFVADGPIESPARTQK